MQLFPLKNTNDFTKQEPEDRARLIGQFRTNSDDAHGHKIHFPLNFKQFSFISKANIPPPETYKSKSCMAETSGCRS